VEGRPDAGLRSLNHCTHTCFLELTAHLELTSFSLDRNQLPLWRYVPRQKLLPLVRYETPYLAWCQEKVRTPALDSYFAFSANLGTHTFYLVFLPILFWGGYPSLGRG
jgi:hypothetical protein